MISQSQFGYTDKEQFIVQKKPAGWLPIIEHGRHPVSNGELSDLSSTRYVISPRKARIHAVILAIILCCDNCGLCKEASVDLSKLR